MIKRDTVKNDIEKMVKVLGEEGVILYPTDTVWGLGCDATSSAAVEKIFRIKKRSDSKSLIILVSNEKMLKEYVAVMPDAAMEIIKNPVRPATIIYPGARNLAPAVIAADGSVGIRVTRNRFCLSLIKRFGKPIVSTSANISGEAAPSNFSEISQEIIDKADYVAFTGRDIRRRRKASRVIRITLDGKTEVLRD